MTRHAEKLMTEIWTEAGAEKMWTFQRNAMARTFYRKHGLAELRTTDGYDNEEKEPDVLLGWKLTS